MATRSSWPFSSARRVNSPGLARRNPGIRPRTFKRREIYRPRPVDLQLAAIFARETVGAGKPEHKPAIDDLAIGRVNNFPI